MPVAILRGEGVEAEFRASALLDVMAPPNQRDSTWVTCCEQTIEKPSVPVDVGGHPVDIEYASTVKAVQRNRLPEHRCMVCVPSVGAEEWS
jgi:hypothetical protein